MSQQPSEDSQQQLPQTLDLAASLNQTQNGQQQQQQPPIQMTLDINNPDGLPTPQHLEHQQQPQYPAVRDSNLTETLNINDLTQQPPQQQQESGGGGGGTQVLTGLTEHGVDSVMVSQQQPHQRRVNFDLQNGHHGGGAGDMMMMMMMVDNNNGGGGGMIPSTPGRGGPSGGGGGGRNAGGSSFQDDDDDPFAFGGGGGGGGDDDDDDPFLGGGGGGGGGGGPGDGGDAQQQQQQPDGQTDVYIWGTDVSISDFKSDCRDFFRTARDDEGARLFAPLFNHLRAIHDPKTFHVMQLPVDFRALKRYSPSFFRKVASHPAECLQLMGSVAEEHYAATFREEATISIAGHNMPAITALRDLGPEQIETLVAVRGMVVRTSKLIPEVRAAHFRCWRCHATEQSVLDRGRIFEPARCNSCGTPNSHELLHNLCLFDDKQVVRVQEAPENLAEGETPVTVSIVVYGDMVDSVVPGDRVIVTGIFRSAPTKLNPNTRIIRSIFRTHVDALHIEKSSRVGGNKSLAAAAGGGQGQRSLMQQQQQQEEEEKGEEGQDALNDMQGGAGGGGGVRHIGGVGDENNIDNGEGGGGDQNAAVADASRFVIDQRTERLLQDLGALPDIEDILVRSLAPAIFGHDEVKRGILCQLFGGSRKQFRHGAFRSELNVLLCGDPGVAKSQLLTRVHDISPRGVYTSGKGSSSVGLTAFVVRDADTGEFVLEPGALVLSDRGICCIDEFDKMGEGTRSVLHEVMEQQTLSIAKAGIISTLNARTSILAAANPKESQWNPGLNIVENLQIEPTLLSRFDLLFLLLDRQDEALDRRLAKHVLKMYADPDAFREQDEEEEQRRQQQQEQNLMNLMMGGNAADDATDDPFAVAPQGQQQQQGQQRGGGGGGGAGAPRGPPHPFLDENRLLSVPHFALYVAYAREAFAPILTPNAQQKIIDAYVTMRQARGTGKVVTATLRQLESMIRISESFAKMRLQRQVGTTNVEAASQLIANALQEAATDPRTGLINMGMFTAPDLNKSSMEASMLRLEHLIKSRYTDAGKKNAPVSELRQLFNEQQPAGLRAVNSTQFAEILSHMTGGGVVLAFSPTNVQFA